MVEPGIKETGFISPPFLPPPQSCFISLNVPNTIWIPPTNLQVLGGLCGRLNRSAVVLRSRQWRVQQHQTVIAQLMIITKAGAEKAGGMRFDGGQTYQWSCFCPSRAG